MARGFNGLTQQRRHAAVARTRTRCNPPWQLRNRVAGWLLVATIRPGDKTVACGRARAHRGAQPRFYDQPSHTEVALIGSLSNVNWRKYVYMPFRPEPSELPTVSHHIQVAPLHLRLITVKKQGSRLCKYWGQQTPCSHPPLQSRHPLVTTNGCRLGTH